MMLTKQKFVAEQVALETGLSFFQVILASCFLGVLAQIKIPLYFTPIPLAGTTFGVMLLGACLGSRKGALAVLCYLLQGCMGLPVWAGGNAGLMHLLGPAGGYLLGYIVQAYVIGWCLEKTHKPSLTKIGSILLCSICLQLGMGTLWLAQFVGFKSCFALGFCPFIAGEMLKAAFVGTYAFKRVEKL